MMIVMKLGVLYFSCYCSIIIIQGAPKSKPLPNYQKIILNRIKACP